jgi:hypothetical protein
MSNGANTLALSWYSDLRRAAGGGGGAWKWCRVDTIASLCSTRSTLRRLLRFPD